MCEINTSHKMLLSRRRFKVLCVYLMHEGYKPYLNCNSCDSKVEHPKDLKLGFNSMFQILELIFQKGWHYGGPLESKDVTNFHTQQTQNLKT
jgi:hypothetical protein